jgi:DNA-binding transcriptional LysR family regulator
MSFHLDGDLLRTFLAVADSGNFTHAGARVGRTQSAVSMQIKRLEESVDAVLFDRGARGVKLTEKGAQLVPNARRIVALFEETAALLDPASLDGRVRIGIPEEYGQSVLSAALNAFSRRHPNVEITVRFGRSADNFAHVQSGELDIAVVFEWQDFSAGEILMLDPTVWVTSDQHFQHELKPLPIALYASSGWCRDFALKSLESRGLDVRVAYTSDTSGGLKLAVTSGLAIAPISRSNIPAGCRELTAADGFGDIDTSHVVLHVDRNARGQAVAGMADAIRDAFRDLSPMHSPAT